MAIKFSFSKVSKTIGKLLPKKAIQKPSNKKSIIKKLPFFKKSSDATILNFSQFDLLQLPEQPVARATTPIPVDNALLPSLNGSPNIPVQIVLHDSQEVDIQVETRVRTATLSSSLLSVLQNDSTETFNDYDMHNTHTRETSAMSRISDISNVSAETVRKERQAPIVCPSSAIEKLENLMEDIVSSTETLYIKPGDSQQNSPAQGYFGLPFPEKVHFWEVKSL